MAHRRRSRKDFRRWEEVNEDQLVDDYLMYLVDMTRGEDADRVKSVSAYWQFARGAYRMDLDDQENGEEPQYRWGKKVDNAGHKGRRNIGDVSEEAD